MTINTMKRFSLVAISTVSMPFALQAFDVNRLKDDVLKAAVDIKDKTVPVVQELTAGNFVAVRSYIREAENPLVPMQAMMVVERYIGPAQTTVLRIIDKMPPIPAHVVTALNGFKSGLGTNANKAVRLIKSHANLIKKVNVQDILNRIADIKIRDVNVFINDLQKDYSIAKMNLEPLKQGALRLKSTVDVLQSAAKNLMKGDLGPLLDDLVNSVQEFVQLKGNKTISEEERQELLDDASNSLLAVTRKLGNAMREAKPFVDALIPFSQEVMSFTVELYKHFGRALWNQLPSAAQVKAREAYDLLKTNEDKIKKVMQEIKAEVIKLDFF